MWRSDLHRDLAIRQLESEPGALRRVKAADVQFWGNNQKYGANDFKAVLRALYRTSRMKTGPVLLSPK